MGKDFSYFVPKIYEMNVNLLVVSSCLFYCFIYVILVGSCTQS